MNRPASQKTTGHDAKAIEVHSVQGSIEAGIVQAFLRSCGIESTTQGLAAQSVHAFTVDGMGKIRILVMESDADAARKIIADYLESNPGSGSNRDR